MDVSCALEAAGVGLSGKAPVWVYAVGSAKPAWINASRRSTQVPHVPQWMAPPL